MTTIDGTTTVSAAALDAEQRQSWVDNGFLILPGALNAGEVAEILDAVERTYARYIAGEIPNLSRDRDSAAMFPPHWDWIDPSWDRREIAFRRWNIIEDDPVFLRLIDQPSIFKPVVELIGPYLQLNMTHMIVLPPGLRDTPYIHVDGGDALANVRTTADSWPILVKAQMFLTDLPEAFSGNFTVVPGTHRTPYRGYDFANSPQGMPDPVQICVNAGDVVLFTHCLWHGASANDSPRDRKTLIYGYSHQCVRPYDYVTASPDVLARCTPRQRRLLGDLDTWSWRAGCQHYAHPDQRSVIFGDSWGGREPPVLNELSPSSIPAKKEKGGPPK